MIKYSIQRRLFIEHDFVKDKYLSEYHGVRNKKRIFYKR